MHVDIKAAEAAIEAARKRAVELNTKMCIAIVDSGANLKAFYRMDDAWVGSIDIAIKKAKTAVFFGMPTGLIGQLSQPGGSLFGIEHSNEGLITFPGGLPIVDHEGVLVGAIGVSGSSVENDHAVAQAGVVPIGVSDLPEHPWRT
ncbi:GlcG/HbpS family heme-binding protein [Methylocapsa acidiphila]|uniref:GlcG/HbpS family heme-binding protein n=1 Tax=Methylocapsa acidiphila TaxID=133552 RepID=UPI000417F30B|nr:heme-binding protein [Methylocapsa acidiphila]